MVCPSLISKFERMKKLKIFFLIGAFFGFTAVALGAFGAHGLEGNISDAALKTWEKAVKYQMFHTAALLVVALLTARVHATSLTWAGWLFILGTVIFSGSLYIYASLGIRTFAMITPIGGVIFLIGWVLFGYAMLKVADQY